MIDLSGVDWWNLILGTVGGLLLFYAAVTKFTTLAAVVQMGSIQERVMPWADLSKRQRPTKRIASAVQGAAEKLSTVVSKSVDTAGQQAEAKTKAVLGTVAQKSGVRDPVSQVKLHDQITYTLSLINVAFTAYLLGAAPQYFYMWHTPKAIVYTVHRWYTFKKQNQHYLLYDFCYWANLLAIVYCWFYPSNATMFQILFMVANGPLAWAVLAFSQSLIFHSAPHMTSVFIHVSPAALTYGLRWYPSEFTVCSNWPACDDPVETSAWNLVTNAHVKFYLVWVFAYYLWVYGLMSRRISERGYKTLFDRVSNRGPTKFLKKVSRSEAVQKLAYMLVHIVFATFTMLLSVLYWRSQVAHTIFILCIFSTSAWNAGTFYFTVFANRYEDEASQRAETPQSPLQSPRRRSEEPASFEKANAESAATRS